MSASLYSDIPSGSRSRLAVTITGSWKSSDHSSNALFEQIIGRSVKYGNNANPDVGDNYLRTIEWLLRSYIADCHLSSNRFFEIYTGINTDRMNMLALQAADTAFKRFMTCMKACVPNGALISIRLMVREEGPGRFCNH